MSVDLDTGNPHPSQFHEFVDGDRSPLVEGEAGHVPEPNPLFRIVLGEIPRAASRDVEELRGEDRIVDLFLGTGGIRFHAAFESGEKLCLVHRIEGYGIRHDHTTVPRTGKARRNAKRQILVFSRGTVWWRVSIRPQSIVTKAWLLSPTLSGEPPFPIQ